MQLSRPHPLHSPKSASRQEVLQAGDIATGRKPAGTKSIGINPWVAICVLAIVGWFADSMLVSIELHRLGGDDFRAHLTHFWYGPPILLALLLLARRILPKAALSVPRFTAGSFARCGRRSGVKRLADRLATRPGEGAVLGVLLRYPNMAMTAHDLAGHAGLAQADGERALADLAGLGLVEEMRLAGTDFYRLTRERHLCDELRELRRRHKRVAKPGGQSCSKYRILAPDMKRWCGGNRGKDKSEKRNKEEVKCEGCCKGWSPGNGQA